MRFLSGFDVEPFIVKCGPRREGPVSFGGELAVFFPVVWQQKVTDQKTEMGRNVLKDP